MIIDDMIAELEAALPPLAADIEGFKDYDAILYKGEEQPAREEVRTALRQLEARYAEDNSNLQDLKALRDHGYPEKVVLNFTPDTALRMKENRDSILTAFAEVTIPGQAVSGTVSLGTVQPR